MAIAPFLAMTATEISSVSALPEKIAWMACHFSPYGLGLSNLPAELPPGSVLIVDDMTPPHRHDPAVIAEQLSMCVDTFRCRGILLDFQRADCAKTQAIAKHLAETLPCSTAVSDPYADTLDCPVFLSPVPPSVPLKAYLTPWKDREIWLDLGPDGEILTLTEKGCRVVPLPCPDPDGKGFRDEALNCHYTIASEENAVRFTLWRTKEDTEALLAEAESLGVVGSVGLFQQLAASLRSSQ